MLLQQHYQRHVSNRAVAQAKARTAAAAAAAWSHPCTNASQVGLERLLQHLCSQQQCKHVQLLPAALLLQLAPTKPL